MLDCKLGGELLRTGSASCNSGQAYWESIGYTCQITDDNELDCECDIPGSCPNEVYPCNYPYYCVSESPSLVPSESPSIEPTMFPTPRPTKGKAGRTLSPTGFPTRAPNTRAPTKAPVKVPTTAPTKASQTQSPVPAPNKAPIKGVVEATPPQTGAPKESTPLCAIDEYLVAGRSCYDVGETINILFGSCDVRADDFFGVYPATADPQSLGYPELWLWTCGDQFCRQLTPSGRLQFDSRSKGRVTWPLGEGRYKVYLIRGNNSGVPYESFKETQEIEISNNC